MYQQKIPQKKKSGCLGCFLKGCLISFVSMAILFSVTVFFSINQLKKNQVIIHMVADGWEEITLKKIVTTFQHDIKIVSADKNKQEFVLKNLKTGKTLTVTKHGITLGDGEYTMKQRFPYPEPDMNVQEKTPIEQGSLFPDIFSNSDSSAETPPFDWILFYPDSKINSRINMSNSSRSFGTYIVTATGATPQDIYGFYSQKMVEKGFQVKAEKQDNLMGGGIRISCMKDKTIRVTIVVKSRKNTQEITLEYEKKNH